MYLQQSTFQHVLDDLHFLLGDVKFLWKSLHDID